MKRQNYFSFMCACLIMAFSGGLVSTSCAGAGNAVSAADVAEDISFDNAGTGLLAANIQDAIIEVADASGCVDPEASIVGVWSGSTFSQASGSTEIEETTGITWTFNADGTYTSNVSDYPGGRYEVLSCIMMVLTSSASSTGTLQVSQGFHVSPTTLSMALENKFANTVPYLLTK